MTDRTSSRQTILDRVRRATPAAGSGAALEVAYDASPRNYVRHGAMSAGERVERMMERLREYDAEVTECAPHELAQTIAARVAASGRRELVVPAGIPTAWIVAAAWQVEDLEWTLDHDLKTGEIEQADGVMTAAFCGVAESGTIVLHHDPEEGRRVLTLLPDWHLCVLRGSQVVETLPEYFARCERVPALVTWISGPSATADIEMTRIKGVHGPRFLDVIMVRDRGTERNLNESAAAIGRARRGDPNEEF